ncbi:MAG: hypothetical protein CFE45_18405 [Burkholderiales bacterium PBB5]|nr:MAG: hypothetical protein CFE45_18405 [Burkholderiales bacterium PBB5]
MRHGLPRPDFLHPVARPGVLAWAWCATGLLVLAVSGLDARSAWVDRQASARRLALAARPANPVVAANPDRVAADKRALEARRWRQRLAHPWPDVWLAGEQASQVVHGHLAWLSLEHDNTGPLRLAGWANDAATAQEAAAALRQQMHDAAPRWAAVRVASVERSSDGQRFELVAQLAWAAP